MIERVFYESPLGTMRLEANEDALVGARFWERGQEKEQANQNVTKGEQNQALQNTCDWLKRYFAGEAPQLTNLLLAPQGSEFQKTVWAKLCQIPYGETVTYGEIAKEIAAERGMANMSPRAVGHAAGKNPIVIVIPCHRLVGANERLVGYASGLEKKRWLLEHERGNMEKRGIWDKSIVK